MDFLLVFLTSDTYFALLLLSIHNPKLRSCSKGCLCAVAHSCVTQRYEHELRININIHSWLETMVTFCISTSRSYHLKALQRQFRLISLLRSFIYIYIWRLEHPVRDSGGTQTTWLLWWIEGELSHMESKPSAKGHVASMLGWRVPPWLWPQCKALTNHLNCLVSKVSKFSPGFCNNTQRWSEL